MEGISKKEGGEDEGEVERIGRVEEAKERVGKGSREVGRMEVEWEGRKHGEMEEA